MEVKKLVMNANPLGDMKNYQIIKFLQHKIDDFKPIPSLIADLQNPAMRGRHWQ